MVRLFLITSTKLRFYGKLSKKGLGNQNSKILSSTSVHSWGSSTDLAWLQDPFTREEIDSVVRNLPNNKAPRPDGFNSEFIKKC